MVMYAIMDLNQGAPIPSVLAKVVDNVDDKKDQNFLETLQVVHPLLEVGTPIVEAIEVPSS